MQERNVRTGIQHKRVAMLTDYAFDLLSATGSIPKSVHRLMMEFQVDQPVAFSFVKRAIDKLPTVARN
jgi:hypothetical protein